MALRGCGVLVLVLAGCGFDPIVLAPDADAGPDAAALEAAPTSTAGWCRLRYLGPQPEFPEEASAHLPLYTSHSGGGPLELSFQLTNAWGVCVAETVNFGVDGYAPQGARLFPKSTETDDQGVARVWVRAGLAGGRFKVSAQYATRLDVLSPLILVHHRTEPP